MSPHESWMVRYGTDVAVDDLIGVDVTPQLKARRVPTRIKERRVTPQTCSAGWIRKSV